MSDAEDMVHRYSFYLVLVPFWGMTRATRFECSPTGVERLLQQGAVRGKDRWDAEMIWGWVKTSLALPMGAIWRPISRVGLGSACPSCVNCLLRR